MPLDPNDLETPQHRSAVTMPVPDAMKVRFSEVAKQLEQAKVQGYVEANFAIRLLELVKDILALAPFVA